MKRVSSILIALALAVAPAAAAEMRAIPALASSDGIQALSAIMAASSRAATVRGLRKVPSVGVVNLNFQPYHRYSDNSSETNVVELRIMARRNAAGIRRLQSALASNPVTARALSRHGVDIGRVVGVMVSSGGSLRLYIL
jgi:hypothetical protein